MFKSLFPIIIFVFFGCNTNLLNLVKAECCYGDRGYSPTHYFFPDQRGYCEDGSRGEPCCGIRRCGWDCCGCNYGCITVEGKNLPEARIILPKTTNTGASLESVRAELEKRLVSTFGGFTRVTGDGGWANEHGIVYSDSTWVYDIAIKPGKKNELKEIAKWLKGVAQQEAIYLRENNKVSFI